MCLDAINPFDTHVSTVTITPANMRASQDSADWRLFKCAFRAFCFVAATFSGIAFFATGEPFALVLSLVFGFLTFKLLVDDDEWTSSSYISSSSRRINNTTVIIPPSASSYPTTRIVHHHHNTSYNPPPSSSPFQLPFNNPFSFQSDNVSVGSRESSSGFPNFLSSSSISSNVPVGSRNQENSLFDNYNTTSPRIVEIVENNSNHASVGRGSQNNPSSFTFDDSEHASIGRKKDDN